MWSVLLAACSELLDPGSAPLVDGAITVDGPIWQTAVTVAPSAAPGAFFDLPELLAAADGPTGTLGEDAAIGKIRHLLCNVPAARDEILRLIGDRPQRWKFVRVTECARPDFCAWAHATLERDPSSPLWWALRGCRDARTRDRIADAGPDEAFAQYWWQDTLPYHPRLVRLVEWGFLGTPETATASGTALNTLGEADGPEAEQALLALFQAAPPAWKDTVALALWARPSEQAQAIHAEVCARNDGSGSCGWTRYDRLDPVTWIRAGVAPERMLERFPGETSQVVDRLSECSWSAASPPDRRACTRSLARVAPDRVPANADPDLAFAQRPYQLQRQLADLGIVAPDDATLGLDALDAAGLTVPIDRVPVDPVALLYELADRVGLASYALSAPNPDAFEFAWREPPEWEGAGQVPVYTFFAWSGTQRFRGIGPETKPVSASVVAFANALFAERGLTVRAALDSDERRIVLASPATLRALSEQNLVLFYPWDTSEDTFVDEL